MKKIKAIFLLVLLSITPLTADAPVIDITNLLKAIENGYTMYEQLNAMYNQVQTAYAQLQQQIKNYENLELGELDARDPLGSWRSLMTYADRLMTYEENIESILRTKNMKWGKNSFSLEDVYSRPPLGEKGYLTDSWDDPFERELTLEEKARFHSKYGISYGHYVRYNVIGEAITKKAGEIKAYFSYQQESLNEDRAKLDAITSTEPEIDSIVAQQQRSNAIMTIVAQDTKTTANNLAAIGQLLADKAVQEDMEKVEGSKYKNSTQVKANRNFERAMINDKEEEKYK